MHIIMELYSENIHHWMPLYFIASEVSHPGCSSETVPGYRKEDLIFILRMSSGVTSILALPFCSILQQTLGTGKILKLLIWFCLLLHQTNW